MVFGVRLFSTHTHLRKGKVVLTDATCFLCNKSAGSEGLHETATYDPDMRVSTCALKVGDTTLLAKLAPGEMIAIKGKYHRKCLVHATLQQSKSS